MASEFEKALLAINSMSYDEKMKYAKELRENHENIIGQHRAKDCVFCKPIFSAETVCDLCFRRVSGGYNKYNMLTCHGCDSLFDMCDECREQCVRRNDGTMCCYDEVGCNTEYCRDCLVKWIPRTIRGDDYCYGRTNIYYGIEEYTHPKFTYDEIMQLGKALEQGHEMYDFHIVKDCVWCCGSNPDQKICDYCFKSMLSTTLYHDEIDIEINCFNCKEKFLMCEFCVYAYGCEECEELYKRYCQKCSISMPSELYCDLHECVIDNPFGHESMTKPCKT